VAPIAPASVRAVREAVGSFAPDVIHAHEPLLPGTSMYATLAARNAGAPVVATFHAFAEDSRLLDLAAPLVRPVWRRIAASVAVSQAAADYVSGPLRPRPRIVPNGVDLAAFTDARPAKDLPEGRYLLWVNRLDEQKGFRAAVDAFALLAPRFPDLWFVVAGDGADRNIVDRLAPEIRARVEMLGTMPHERLPRLYASADVFCAPAIGQESFGIVLVEAMAAGVPVVASDIPGYREVLPSACGDLVPAGEANALAEAIGNWLQDPARAAQAAKAGPAAAARFDWASVGPQLEGIYTEVLTGR